MDPVGTCFIRGRTHHRSRTRRRNDDGFTPKRGVLEELDVNEEGIHIKMHDDACVIAARFVHFSPSLQQCSPHTPNIAHIYELNPKYS